jgi:hypothetical protein
MAWFGNKEKSLNLKFKPHNTYNTNQIWNYMVRYYLSTVAITVTLGVLQGSSQNARGAS